MNVLLEEFKTLKAEQTARIGFRDNLIYVTVASVGAVSAFALSKDGTLLAFLVIPWLTVILGWTYLVNDEKISAIGRYVRTELRPKVETLAGADGNSCFLWEYEHRSDTRRRSRKVFQLIVDLVTFTGSGLAAIAIYLSRVPAPSGAAATLVAIEAILVLFLALQILLYADLDKSKAGSEKDEDATASGQ